jgi:phage virion morphogenesis protein
MAGAQIEITKDSASEGVRSAIIALEGNALELMLSDIGEYLVRATRERAKREVSPEGEPWKALSPRYKKYKDKKRPGVPKLKFDFHMLGDQFTYQVDRDELLVGTNAKYGAIHQFGGDINIPARSQEAFFSLNKNTGVSRFAKRSRANFAQRVTLPAYTIKMPARPWLGVSTEDAEEIGAIAQDHLSALFDLGT